MKKRVHSKNTLETEQLGSLIGRALRGGEVIELSSDLGGGKTTLTRGVVAGTGSEDLVSSPTFTISNVYEAPKMTIHHFDFYRLNEAGLMKHEIADVIDERDSVVIVEWSDVVADVLPEERLSISIASSEDEARDITIEYPKSLEYLVEKL